MKVPDLGAQLRPCCQSSGWECGAPGRTGPPGTRQGTLPRAAALTAWPKRDAGTAERLEAEEGPLLLTPAGTHSALSRSPAPRKVGGWTSPWDSRADARPPTQAGPPHRGRVSVRANRRMCCLEFDQ